jgi:hypothetical protein
MKRRPALANVYQRPTGCKVEIKLAGVSQRWREVERAMGIEPTRAFLPNLQNKRFGAIADAKCD